jgi:murein DD-endopeptidase MepM/ murein hydrolase activator NlpD
MGCGSLVRRGRGPNKGEPVKPKFTLLVVPTDHAQPIRQLKVTPAAINIGAGALGLIIAGAVALAVQWNGFVDTRTDNLALTAENVRLTTRLMALESRIEGIGDTLQRVERFDAKLRALAENDLKAWTQKRGKNGKLPELPPTLAIGPVGAPPTSPEGKAGALADILTSRSAKRTDAEALKRRDELLNLQLGVHEKRLDKLQVAAVERARSLRELESYLDAQRAVLAATPSAWPAKGWVTSFFGHRSDPMNGRRVFHHGLDISNRIGTPILATADGTVVHADWQSEYGRLVAIDHGYGTVTKYAHLSAIAVEPGQKVRRGQKIGALGSSGRSTGEHLHYEVEINGVPVDPRQYLP